MRRGSELRHKVYCAISLSRPSESKVSATNGTVAWIAQLHRGRMILPSSVCDSYRAAGGRGGGSLSLTAVFFADAIKTGNVGSGFPERTKHRFPRGHYWAYKLHSELTTFWREKELRWFQFRAVISRPRSFCFPSPSSQQRGLLGRRASSASDPAGSTLVIPSWVGKYSTIIPIFREAAMNTFFHFFLKNAVSGQWGHWGPWSGCKEGSPNFFTRQR